MKKDLPQNFVDNISVAIVLEEESVVATLWCVYLINEKKVAIDNVLVSSRGYGNVGGKDLKTTTLRHFIGNMGPESAVKVEAIDNQVFGLTNEYWVSFYVDGVIFDKKYIFLPESIIDENFIKIPIVNKPGVMIGGMN